MRRSPLIIKWKKKQIRGRLGGRCRRRQPWEAEEEGRKREKIERKERLLNSEVHITPSKYKVPTRQGWISESVMPSQCKMTGIHCLSMALSP